MSALLLHEIFQRDVARDIPPVVYFHEQDPARLREEVDEYIVTSGIHEQYVRLLRALAAELDKDAGPSLPTAWISGLYGSGKSSFAKLFALALDGAQLAEGRSLAMALLARDMTADAPMLREAWSALRDKIDPIAVVFDIGAVARDNEPIHSAAVRQVSNRLGYCSTEPWVAAFELALERDGQWSRFEQVATQTLGRPWAEVKDKALAEEDFSLVMSVLHPERYTDPMSWFTSRGGTSARGDSPEEAVRAIGDMLSFRRPGTTLFLVIDEVSQYVLAHKDRVDRLRAFTSALGSALKGRVWLVALGQQRLEEQADDSFLAWAKDRFPQKLRVHLSPTNIRDVVHQRLLLKKPEIHDLLCGLCEEHRANLKLYAYGCEATTASEFACDYPLLPGYIDLLLSITSVLRTRSSRAQGDDQSIRGLLQLLGELFRGQGLAERPLGTLITLDLIYDVQATALEPAVQATMERILARCASMESGLLVRAAKVVALLELVQDTLPTEAELVARCLYDRLDRGNQVDTVTRALEELRRLNLLGYSEKHGYKIQSTTSEEWEGERRDIGVSREAMAEIVCEALASALAATDPPRLQGKSFPLSGLLSDGRKLADNPLIDRREDAVVRVDFRYLVKEERTQSTWVRQSDEAPLRERLLWVCGEIEQVEQQARELFRARAMVQKYKPRRESLQTTKKQLLQQEEDRASDLESRVLAASEAAWMNGRMYFRGRPLPPSEYGARFADTLNAATSRILLDLFPHFVGTALTAGELMQLVEPELSGPSPKLLSGELGILELDGGRYIPSCTGVVVRRVQEHLELCRGLGGGALLAHFGSPPYGYAANVVKACVAGLLRAGRIRVSPEGNGELTAIRDAGVRELFEKDRVFRQAGLLPAEQGDIGFQARARLCQFFERTLHHSMDREDSAIADAVSQLFPRHAQRVRRVLERLEGMGRHTRPPVLVALQEALDQCVAYSRQTQPTVQLVQRKLEQLRAGFMLLEPYEAEITDEAVQTVQQAISVRDHQLAQMAQQGLPAEVQGVDVQLRTGLAQTTPWRDLPSLSRSLLALREAYVAERRRLLEGQEELAESARARIKARAGFTSLSPEQARKVLRPLGAVLTETTAEAVAPPLQTLAAPFQLALARAESDANERLDALLTEGGTQLICKLDLRLKNREIQSKEEVEVLVDEIRARLLEQLGQLAPERKVRIRIV